MFKPKSTLCFTLGALGTVTGLTLALPARAEGNPFSMQTLASGYKVAEAKTAEGKCGEGKCGGKTSSATPKADKAAKAGKQSADKKMAEGKCGEGKCGGKMKGSAKEAAADSK